MIGLRIRGLYILGLGVAQEGFAASVARFIYGLPNQLIVVGRCDFGKTENRRSASIAKSVSLLDELAGDARFSQVLAEIADTLSIF